MHKPAELGLGVAFGLVFGLVVVELGTLALLPLAVVVVIGVGVSLRPLFAGVLLGAGGLWLAIAILASVECLAPDMPCGSGPNFLPLTLLGLLVTASGVAATLRAWRGPGAE
jgi:hypothetical protein